MNQSNHHHFIGQTLTVPNQSLEFALVAESGVLERQAIILCESIRKFAGKYADSPITVISPRSDRRPSVETMTRLTSLVVRFLVDRKAGIFGRTLEYFKHSIEADIAPFRGSGLRVRAGHGLVSERGSELWGSSQACLFLVIWGSGLSVRTWGLPHNFPLHLFDCLTTEEQSTSLRVIHYHHILDGESSQNPLLNGRANVSGQFVSWLRNELAQGEQAGMTQV